MHIYIHISFNTWVENMVSTDKDKIKELMRNISKASFISLFVFLFIWYLSTLLTFKSLINALNNQTLSILILELFLITLALSYKTPRDTITNTLTNKLTYLEKHYPEVPSIIIGIGCFLLLVVFLVIINVPPKAPTPSTLYGWILMVLTGLGLFIFFIGLILLIVGFSARTYKKLPKLSEWILKNKDTIFQDIRLIVSMILFILAVLYQLKVP